MVSPKHPRVICLIDDHSIVRRGMRNLLTTRIIDVEIAEAASLRELSTILEKEHMPDLLILDLQLADGNALDRVGQLLEQYPGLRILVYTMAPEQIYAQRALSMGCMGYLTKDSSEDEVYQAVRTVMGGNRYLSHTLQLRMLDYGISSPDDDPFARLSVRETRVMEELLTGSGIKEIAARMSLGASTVATYKARLFDKMGVTNVMELGELVRTYRG